MKKIIATTLVSSALLASTAFADGERHVDFSTLSVDIKQAIDIANSTIEGNVTDVSFDVERGVNIWEVEVLGQDMQDHELKIDANSGEVISQHVDH